MANFRLGKIYEFEKCYIANPIRFGEIYLYQVGEIGVENNIEIGAHINKCHEICYVVSGEGFFYTNDKCERVSQGGIHVVSKDASHRIVAASPQGIRFIYLGFDFDRKSNQEAYKDIIKFYSENKYLVTYDFDVIRNLLDMLVKEFYSPVAYKNIMVESILNQVLIYVYRLHSSNESKPFVPNLNQNLFEPVIYSLVKYIDDNIFEVKSIQEIAKELNYNECYLSHLFKSKMGVTLKQYILGQKVQISQELLVNEEYSVTDISQKLNFSSPQHFNKVFKKYTGFAPTEFRKSIKINSYSGLLNNK